MYEQKTVETKKKERKKKTCLLCFSISLFVLVCTVSKRRQTKTDHEVNEMIVPRHEENKRERGEERKRKKTKTRKNKRDYYC